MSGEYLCELVRAHYDGDSERFDTILSQIINSESRIGSRPVANRLIVIRQSAINEERNADIQANCQFDRQQEEHGGDG